MFERKAEVELNVGIGILTINRQAAILFTPFEVENAYGEISVALPSQKRLNETGLKLLRKGYSSLSTAKRSTKSLAERSIEFVQKS